MQETNNDQKKKGLLQDMRNSFFAGLFIVIPVIVTFWVGFKVVTFTTDWAIEGMAFFLPNMKTSPVFETLLRLATIAAIVVFVSFIGLFTKATLGRRILSLMQRILLKVPLLRTVYSTCEQIGHTVKTSRGGLFKKVVMFEYPRKGCYSIGFITNFNEEPSEISGGVSGDFYSIFMPTTPNPTSGFLMLIPKSECRILDMSVSDAMTLIVSGGAMQPSAAKNADDQQKTL